MGFIVLQGGAEFADRMAVVDRQAMALAGGFDSPIRIIPAAAAPDHNHRRAGQNGVNWFQQLGAGCGFKITPVAYRSDGILKPPLEFMRPTGSSIRIRGYDLEERRNDWVRIGKWSSVHLPDLKIANYLNLE